MARDKHLPTIWEVRIRNSHRSDPTLRRVLVEQYKPIGIPIRQWAQQNAVDEAEDDAGRADAQCQGDNRGQSEAQLLHQHSQPVARVLPECFHITVPHRLMERQKIPDQSVPTSGPQDIVGVPRAPKEQ
jgi:hypothetical protein